jgi:8-hydroxy-5-deazaflavin:NADPH oxidoreductase
MANTATASLPTIAVLGGTGSEGGGLALRWAAAGYSVIIGSRQVDRAEAAAERLSRLAKHPIRGLVNTEAASAADVVVLAVPYASQHSTANDVKDQLRGKVLIDVTVPLIPPKVSRVQLPSSGSAVEALQRGLGGGVRVVSAFQNVSAHQLLDPAHAVDCDVLVCGDDEAARQQVIELAQSIGVRAWHAGPLANSAASEALTSVLIFINRYYKVPASGIRITGAPAQQVDEPAHD